MNHRVMMRCNKWCSVTIFFLPFFPPIDLLVDKVRFCTCITKNNIVIMDIAFKMLLQKMCRLSSCSKRQNVIYVVFALFMAMIYNLLFSFKNAIYIFFVLFKDRKSTRLNSSHVAISY